MLQTVHIVKVVTSEVKKCSRKCFHSIHYNCTSVQKCEILLYVANSQRVKPFSISNVQNIHPLLYALNFSLQFEFATS